MSTTRMDRMPRRSNGYSGLGKGERFLFFVSLLKIITKRALIERRQEVRAGIVSEAYKLPGAEYNEYIEVSMAAAHNKVIGVQNKTWVDYEDEKVYVPSPPKLWTHRLSSRPAKL